MKFIWIIQDSCEKHYNWTELYKCVALCGSEAVYIPMERAQYFHLQKGYVPVVIGGDDYLALASENIMLRSGIYYNDAFFNVNNYIKLWKHNYLNCDAKIVTSESLSQHDFPFFIRPLRDDKSLDGQVVNTEYELLNIQSFFYNSGTYFCVSAIKNIHREWRAVIVNKIVVSVCRYAVDHQTSVSQEDVPDKLLLFIKSHCNIISAPMAWVMDIAECQDHFFVLECNIFNASNFYDCDRKGIVSAVETSLQCKCN